MLEYTAQSCQIPRLEVTAYSQPLIYNSNFNPILNQLTLTNNHKVYVSDANKGSLLKEVISLLFKSFV